MIEPIKQEWVADSDIQQGKLVWIGHDMRARLTLSIQGVPPTGHNWEAESDVKAGETGTFIRREKRKAHGTVNLTSPGQNEASLSQDQAAVTWAHTVNDRARNIR